MTAVRAAPMLRRRAGARDLREDRTMDLDTEDQVKETVDQGDQMMEQDMEDQDQELDQKVDLV